MCMAWCTLHAGMLYVASEEDVSLLGGAQAHLLVRAAGPLQQRLAAIAASGALNLVPLSAAALADVFLPAMLPLDWRWGTATQASVLFGFLISAQGGWRTQGMAHHLLQQFCFGENAQRCLLFLAHPPPSSICKLNPKSNDCRGAAEVEWTPGADGHPTAEALSVLWRRISAFPPADTQVRPAIAPALVQPCATFLEHPDSGNHSIIWSQFGAACKAQALPATDVPLERVPKKHLTLLPRSASAGCRSL